MKYPSGEKIKLDDHVLIEQGTSSAKVVRIIENKIDMDEVKANEPGVFLTSEPCGVVFWPIKEKHDPIKFFSRGETFRPFDSLDQI